MVYGYRYIQLYEDGRVKTAGNTAISGVTIDTEGMEVPEMPTDGIYDLYYSEEEGLHYEKVADFEEEKATQLDRIESMVAKSQEEIAQEARDAYTLELIEGGVIA